MRTNLRDKKSKTPSQKAKTLQMKEKKELTDEPHFRGWKATQDNKGTRW